MNSRRLLCAVVVVIVAGINIVLADGLNKYKGWDDTPEGYFMTRAERAQWTAIRTDADAAAFVTSFRAARKEGFADEVAKRTSMADKYMTIGKLAGSKTMRGKTIILLGPPAALNVSDEVRNDRKYDNPDVAGAMSNVGSTAAAGRGSSSEASNVSGGIGTASRLRRYHIEYAADPAIKRDKVDVMIEADANTGKDRIASRSEAAKLDDAFEAAAQSWLKK